jgi:hypothetical protein
MCTAMRHMTEMFCMVHVIVLQTTRMKMLNRNALHLRGRKLAVNSSRSPSGCSYTAIFKFSLSLRRDAIYFTVSKGNVCVVCTSQVHIIVSTCVSSTLSPLRINTELVFSLPEADVYIAVIVC